MDSVLSGLRAVAEPTRLRLVLLCAEAELTVSDLVGILGQSQPRVSRHLKLLCEAGLLDRFREGSRVFYRLAGEGALAPRLLELLPA
ncbi:MAG TPA: metalloregulator ArsR/SmtB family transcription factor, partial [Stellaceae bacterium]|nr:metalloregulator ArsR/SmtB family transcription factor [Stellaceae bacterium]